MDNSIYILWKNSLDTIKWFKNLKHKRRTAFIEMDIIDFYLSITKELLLQSINLANYTDISKQELDIILANIIVGNLYELIMTLLGKRQQLIILTLGCDSSTLPKLQTS